MRPPSLIVCIFRGSLYSRAMFRVIARTSWLHIVRTKKSSFFVVSMLVFLSATLFFAVFVFSNLQKQKYLIEEKLFYPLFLSEGHAYTHPRVRDFLEDIPVTGVKKYTYISSEEALDEQIQRDPQIIDLLSWTNPFPNSITLFLSWVNIEALSDQIRAYRDIFEPVQFEEIRKTLKRFDLTLQRFGLIEKSIRIFLVSTFLVIIVAFYLVIRYHFRVFQSERDIARLVGADPIFVWWPYVFSLTLYITCSLLISGLLFWVLSSIFSF